MLQSDKVGTNKLLSWTTVIPAARRHQRRYDVTNNKKKMRVCQGETVKERRLGGTNSSIIVYSNSTIYDGLCKWLGVREDSKKGTK